LPKNVKIKIYKTIVLPVLSYVFGTWSLTLSDEHRFRAFEKGVLRKIFEPKRKEVAGD
jgi:hypothetical protein